MQLFTSPTSPYARLVRVVLAENQLSDRVEMHFLDPWSSPAELIALNPACRVPTFVTANGHALVETAVIVLFLEQRYPEPRLMPRDAVELVHRRLGLALSLLDAGIGVFTERRHGDATTTLAERRAQAMQRAAVSVADAIDSHSTKDPDLGELALAVSLDWIDYRFATEVVWRSRYPAVAAWLDQMLARPSFVQTAPPPAS